jgi:hypothetical protein
MAARLDQLLKLGLLRDEIGLQKGNTVGNMNMVCADLEPSRAESRQQLMAVIETPRTVICFAQLTGPVVHPSPSSSKDTLSINGKHLLIGICEGYPALPALGYAESKLFGAGW